MSLPKLPKRPPVPKMTAAKPVTPPVKPVLPVKAGPPVKSPGATPSGGPSTAAKARDRAREVLERRPAPAPATKKDAVKAAAKDVATEAAKGAVKGAGGGLAGAGAGAAKGAVVGVLKNRTLRNMLIGLVVAIVVALVAFPTISLAIVSYSIAAISGSDDQGSFSAAVDSGSERDAVNAARNHRAATELPWQLILALQERTKQEIDTDKLLAAFRDADPTRETRNLAAGSVYDDEKLVRKLGTTDAQKASAEAVKQTYLAALTAYGLTEGQAESIYKTALKWTLGEAMSCAPPQYTGEDGQSTSLSAEQSANALTIIGVAKYMFPAADQRRAAIIGIATARQESGLRAIDYGDEAGPDSRGLFQQRDSWGPLELRMDPAGSAGLFFKRLLTVPGWQQMSLGDAAYAVQIFQEDLKHHYDKYEPWATAYVDQSFASTAPVTPPAAVGAAPGAAGGEAVPSGCLTAVPGDWVAPIDLTTPGIQLSDFFGPRIGIPGAASFHAGLDISAPARTPIKAVHGGVVESAGPKGTLGNSIILLHDDGVRTQYSHIIDGGILVKAGDTVTAGQTIALVGSTGGISTGNHLDIRTYVGPPSLYTAKDPIYFLLERGVDLRVIPISGGLTTKPTF